MPGRSNRDEKQADPEPGFAGVMHRFRQAVGLSPPDPEEGEKISPSSPEPVKTPTSKATDALANRGQQIDQAVEDASK